MITRAWSWTASLHLILFSPQAERRVKVRVGGVALPDAIRDPAATWGRERQVVVAAVCVQDPAALSRVLRGKPGDEAVRKKT